jgi:hypothetical protein
VFITEWIQTGRNGLVQSECQLLIQVNSLEGKRLDFILGIKRYERRGRNGRRFQFGRRCPSRPNRLWGGKNLMLSWESRDKDSLGKKVEQLGSEGVLLIQIKLFRAEAQFILESQR